MYILSNLRIGKHFTWMSVPEVPDAAKNGDLAAISAYLDENPEMLNAYVVCIHFYFKFTAVPTQPITIHFNL